MRKKRVHSATCLAVALRDEAKCDCRKINNNETRLKGRLWPTEKIRPHETISDYCRRLDGYLNREL